LNEKLTSISESFALWFVPFTVNTAAALKLLESRRTEETFLQSYLKNDVQNLDKNCFKHKGWSHQILI